MPQDKSERLVLRITSDLKKEIERHAKKQNISASELVRNVLEDVVCKNKKEIEKQVTMISTIDKRINHLLQELVFSDTEKTISSVKKELRDYKRLSYSQQVEAIQRILEEVNYNDSKTQQLIKMYDSDSRVLEHFSESIDDADNEAIQEKSDVLYERLWNSTNKLYRHLCTKYLNNKKTFL